MEKQQYRISIRAPREVVWDILWGEKTYPAWTSAFAEGSNVETDWEEGSKVLFHDGKGEGMVSMIAVKRAPEFMSFRHLGFVKDGVEDTTSEKVKPWAGAMENYTLVSQNGNTEVMVELDITEEFKSYFENTWPKALQKLKELSEAGVNA